MKTTHKILNSGIARSSWLQLGMLGIVATFVMYVETMVIPAIPDMIKDFAIPYNTSSWILASYLVIAAVTAPILGKLSDVYGRKKLLLISVMIYSAGIAIGGIANSLPIMLIARSMQGNQTAIKGFSGLFPSSESYNFIFLTGFIVSVVTLALSIMIRKGLKIQTVKEELDDSNSINWLYELQTVRLKLIQGIRQFVILVFEQMIRFVQKLSSLRNNKFPSKKLLFLECEVNS